MGHQDAPAKPPPVYEPPRLLNGICSMQDDRFLALFLKHERSLAAFARTLLPDWESVDDVIQNSSMVLWRKIDTLDTDENFLRWAMVVVRLEAMKYRRGKARDRMMLSAELVERLANEAESEHDQSLADARSEALSACLESFGSDHQRLLLAPHVAHGEISRLAKLAGTTANALYKKVARLRMKLHDCILARLHTEAERAL